MNALKKAIDLVSDELAKELRYFKASEIEEIRIRLNKKPCIIIAGMEQQLNCSSIKSQDIKRIVEKATAASYYMAEEGLSDGYINYEGLRIGVCGNMSCRNGQAKCFRNITSLAIRIPHECRGICDELAGELYKNGYKNSLIISPPGGGKTTAIRELCRVLSENGNRVALLDERNEILADDGRSCFDLGLRCDVLTGVNKEQGSQMMLRTMNPQIIAMDEITKKADVEAVYHIAGCGVSILASAHGKDKRELLKRKIYSELLEMGIFEYLIFISGNGSKRKFVWESLR